MCLCPAAVASVWVVGGHGVGLFPGDGGHSGGAGDLFLWSGQWRAGGAAQRLPGDQVGFQAPSNLDSRFISFVYLFIVLFIYLFVLFSWTLEKVFEEIQATESKVRVNE